MLVKEVYLSENASRCINGYCISEQLQQFNIQESGAKVCGLININTSLREHLQTEQAMKVTRCSISQFESFLHSSSLSEHSLLNIESVRCLFLGNTPGASKVRATLEAQVPELSDAWKELIAEVKSELTAELKDEVKKEIQSQQLSQNQISATASASSTATFGIQLTEGDEVTVTVKNVITRLRFS
eukprot:2207180-Amphidinium_carterae.2